jgi:hypothetical protein
MRQLKQVSKQTSVTRKGINVVYSINVFISEMLIPLNTEANFQNVAFKIKFSINFFSCYSLLLCRNKKFSNANSMKKLGKYSLWCHLLTGVGYVFEDSRCFVLFFCQQNLSSQTATWYLNCTSSLTGQVLILVNL